MKRLERIVDMIGVLGIEQNGERISMQAEDTQFVAFGDALLKQKICEMIERSTLAKRAMAALIRAENGVVTVKADVNLGDQKVLRDMIEQVQGVKSVKVTN